MTLHYFVPAGGDPVRITLAVFDAAGRRIAELTPETLSTDGEGVAVWNLHDLQGRRVGAGMYFARMTLAGGKTTPSFVQRIVVLP